MNKIDDFFEYLGVLLLIINSCLYIWSYSVFKNIVALKYFIIYIVSICIIQVIGHIYAHNLQNNLHLSHFYFIIQFICLSFFYKTMFTKIQKRMVYYLLGGVLIILVIQYYKNPELYFQFNSLEIFITSLPLIIYSIVHMYNSLNKSPEYMYINAGILIYITTSTLIFLLGVYLSSFRNNDAVKNIWFINKILYTVYMVLILIEWKMNFRPVKQKS